MDTSPGGFGVLYQDADAAHAPSPGGWDAAGFAADAPAARSAVVPSSRLHPPRIAIQSAESSSISPAAKVLRIPYRRNDADATPLLRRNQDAGSRSRRCRASGHSADSRRLPAEKRQRRGRWGRRRRVRVHGLRLHAPLCELAKGASAARSGSSSTSSDARNAAATDCLGVSTQ